MQTHIFKTLILLSISVSIVACNTTDKSPSEHNKIAIKEDPENKIGALWGSYDFMSRFPFSNLKKFDTHDLYTKIRQKNAIVDSTQCFQLFNLNMPQDDDTVYRCSIQKSNERYKAFTFLFSDLLSSGTLIWYSFDKQMHKIDEKLLAEGLYENGVDKDVETLFVNDSEAIITTVYYNAEEAVESNVTLDSFDMLIDSFVEKAVFKYDGHINTLKTDSFKRTERTKNTMYRRDNDDNETSE
jgi:hypothetical protein